MSSNAEVSNCGASWPPGTIHLHACISSFHQQHTRETCCGIAVILPTTRRDGTRGEQTLIHEHPNGLNDRKGIRQSYIRWPLPQVLPKKKRQIQQSTTKSARNIFLIAHRLDFRPLDALCILTTATRVLPPRKYSPVQACMLTYWKAHAHIPLLGTLKLHVPFVSNAERLLLCHACAKILRDTPYPKALGAYRASIIAIPT